MSTRKGHTTRFSNGTGQYNFSGQRDRSFFIVTGQAQNLAKGWDGSGQLKSGTGRDGTGRDSQNPGRDAGQNGTEQKKDVLKQENDVLKQKTLF